MSEPRPMSKPRPMRTTAELSVRESLADKHLLVSGATGFLGKVWLALVLQELPEIGSLTLLVRPKRTLSPEARLRQILDGSPALRPLRERHGAALHDFIASKVRVVEAELSEPDCGLGNAAASLCAKVDLTVCFAGLTDFEPDPLAAIDANVLGTLRMADLAARTPSKRYLHISTTYVAGTPGGTVAETLRPGRSPLLDDFDADAELEQLQQSLEGIDSPSERIRIASSRARELGWPNIYTYSKGLAEQLLARRDDVAVATLRPAIVECARTFPFPGWNEGINTSGPLVWLLGTPFRRFPGKPNHHFDVIPVDSVARAALLVLALQSRDEAADVYQAASSGRNPFRFERALDLTGLAWRRLHREQKHSLLHQARAHLETLQGSYDRDDLVSIADARKATQGLRDLLRDDPAKRYLPEAIYRYVGLELSNRTRKATQKLRNADRLLGRIEEMLRLFRPFIYDTDWVFETDRLIEATGRLRDDERSRFGFDIESLDWRDYWVNVQVPGLERWCLPLLRGDRVESDEADVSERATAKQKSALAAKSAS